MATRFQKVPINEEDATNRKGRQRRATECMYRAKSPKAVIGESLLVSARSVMNKPDDTVFELKRPRAQYKPGLRAEEGRELTNT